MSLSPNVHRESTQTREPVKFFTITPKQYVLIALVILGVIAGTPRNDHAGLLNLGIGLVTALVFDGTIRFFQGCKRLFSDGGVVTGLIIALVLSSSAPWYVISATTLIALLSKHILKIKRRPIFNPAALGLFLAIFLFSSEQSWWGAFAELPVLSLALLIVAGFLVTARVNKFPAVFAFLGVYFSFFLGLGLFGFAQAGDAFRVPFVNSALFLAFFMVSDPPTTPGKISSQVFFGAVTALVATVAYVLFGGLAYLFAGLLVANVMNAFRVSQAVKG